VLVGLEELQSKDLMVEILLYFPLQQLAAAEEVLALRPLLSNLEFPEDLVVEEEYLLELQGVEMCIHQPLHCFLHPLPDKEIMVVMELLKDLLAVVAVVPEKQEIQTVKDTEEMVPQMFMRMDLQIQ
jgi:hypothetical protein